MRYLLPVFALAGLILSAPAALAGQPTNSPSVLGNREIKVRTLNVQESLEQMKVRGIVPSASVPGDLTVATWLREVERFPLPVDTENQILSVIGDIIETAVNTICSLPLDNAYLLSKENSKVRLGGVSVGVSLLGFVSVAVPIEFNYDSPFLTASIAEPAPVIESGGLGMVYESVLRNLIALRRQQRS